MWSYLASWLPWGPQKDQSHLNVDDFYDLSKKSTVQDENHSPLVIKWLETVAKQDTSEVERRDLLDYIVASKNALNADTLRQIQETLLEIRPLTFAADHFSQLFNRDIDAVATCADFVHPTPFATM